MSENLTKHQQNQVKKEVEKQVSAQLRAKKVLSSFKNEFKQQTSTAIIAAFSLLIALSWKDVVTRLIENFAQTSTLTQNHSYLGLVYIAVIMTAFGVLGIALVSRWSRKEDPQTLVALSK